MILTKERAEEQARLMVDEYLAQVMGSHYRTGTCHQQEGRIYFKILCQRENMRFNPAVGGISMDLALGQIDLLTEDQIRNFRESGEVQAAHQRRELARDKQGYLLRLQARIKANAWVSDYIGIKVRAEGGQFIASTPPVWCFSITFQADDIHLEPLGTIEVDACTGQVTSLIEAKIQAIQGAIRAARRHPTLATEG